MSKKQIIINSINISVSNGWQGDPVYLARKISEQIQSQAKALHTSKEMSISLSGNYYGIASRVTNQFSEKLNAVNKSHMSGFIAGESK